MQDKPTTDTPPTSSLNLDTISELQVSNQWRSSVENTRAFDRESGQWLCWKESDHGGLWERDSDLVTREHTEILGQLLDFASARIPEKKDQAPEIAAAKLRSRWEVRRVVHGAIQFSKDHLSKDAGQYFDRQPAIVGLSNGEVIDLRTGKTRPGTPADRITITLQDGVAPDQVKPIRWLQFVSELLGNYPEADRLAIEDWLQRAAGYSLAAETSAEVLPFLHGPPGTGKSTFIETLSWIAGKHHCGLPADALAAGLPTHRQWLARLQGRRVATLTETASDAAWKSAELSSIVSGEVVVANHMRQNSFEFEPVCTIWVSGNHQPRCDPGSGLFRRLRVIDCTHAPKRKERLKAIFRTIEPGGILQWMIEGAVKYYKFGLDDTPAAILKATEQYKDDQDSIGDFFRECLESGNGAESTSADIHQKHIEWATSEGWRRPWSRTKLGKELRRRGYDSYRQGGKATTWLGLKLV